MLPALQVDRDNPFHTIARRTCEHQFRIEVFVLQELFFELVGISDMVKVKAQQSRVLYQFYLAPFAEQSDNDLSDY